MKNYEEMANDVLNRINEFDEAKKKRRIKITRVATSVTPVCAIALIGVGLWKSGVLTENEQLINKNFGVTDNCTDDLFSQNNNQGNMALHTEVITNSTVPDSENDTTQLQTNKNNLTSTIIDNKTQQSKGDTDSKQETKTVSAFENDTKQSQTEKSNFNTSISADKTQQSNDNTAIDSQLGSINSQQENSNVADQNLPGTNIVDKGLVSEETSIPSESNTNIVDKGFIPEETSSPSEKEQQGNGWCIFISTLELNGITYHDNDTANVSAYSQGDYLGKVRDFKGEYDDNMNYRINSNDSVYSVNETNDVLFVIKEDGSIVVMSSSNWSLEKYESERTEQDYSDKDTENLTVFNGFCR